jgi:hypothetical protein
LVGYADLLWALKHESHIVPAILCLECDDILVARTPTERDVMMRAKGDQLKRVLRWSDDDIKVVRRDGKMRSSESKPCTRSRMTDKKRGLLEDFGH